MTFTLFALATTLLSTKALLSLVAIALTGLAALGMSYQSNDDLIRRMISVGLLNASGRDHLQSFTETVLFSQFTDGGGTSGTYQMAAGVPAGSIIFCTPQVLVNTGFTGDTTATLIIGDGSDTDRYNTGTPSVFTTAATGVDMGVPSGVKRFTSRNRPTLTVTSGSDFTLVTAGSITVTIFYIRTQD